MSIFLLILGIVLFICLVLVHEFGHFTAARRNGVEVEEFGLFFPPRLWSKKTKSGFRLSINLLPLGGFVKLKGEHDSDKAKGSYGSASMWAKVKIMMAGVGMNLLTAFVIFTVLAVISLPEIIPNQFLVSSNTKVYRQTVLVDSVEPNSAASKIGLKSNYKIISIGEVNGPTEQVYSSQDLPGITQSLAGKTVNITYVNNSHHQITSTVKLRSSPNENVKKGKKTVNEDVGYLGISTEGVGRAFAVQKSTWAAPIVALGLMKQITVLTFQGLGHVFRVIFNGHPSQASQSVTGPVGVVQVLKNSSTLGYQFVFFVIGLISLSLAIINVLPIPALDGGKLFYTLIPRLINGKPLKQKTEDIINVIGLVLILIIFVLITIGDISRIHQG